MKTTRPANVAQPLADLRADGCRVGTVIGHNPKARIRPSWHYSVRLPDDVKAQELFPEIIYGHDDDMRWMVGTPRISDGHHVIVYARTAETARTLLKRVRSRLETVRRSHEPDSDARTFTQQVAWNSVDAVTRLANALGHKVVEKVTTPGAVGYVNVTFAPKED